MRLLAVVALVLSLAGAAAAATRLPAAQPGVPNFPAVPGAWSHVDINLTIKHQPHTITLDRGKIIQVTTTQLTLREQDGTTPVIPLTPTAIVKILGRPGTLYDLRRKEQVETMRIDGGPAVRIRVTSRG
jgi:type 1 fimbria pilin